MTEQQRRKISLWTTTLFAAVLMALGVLTFQITGSPEAAQKAVQKEEIHGTIYTWIGGEKRFLKDVTVHAVHVQTGAESDRVKTDCIGNFRIPPQKLGSYRICWSKPGYASACSSLPVTVSGPTAYTPTYALTPNAGVAVAGAVTLAGGAPAAYSATDFNISEQAEVSLLDAGTLQTVAQQDACKGAFTFAGVAAGNYLLQADYAGNRVTVPLSGSQAELVLNNAPPEIAAVWAGDGANGVVRAAPGSTLFIHIEADDPDGDPLTYRVITQTGTTFNTGDPNIIGWTLDDSGAARASLLVDDGRGGFDRRSLSVSTAESVRFTGAVLGVEGQALAGATVRVDDRETVTDEQGWFELDLFRDSSRYVFTIQRSGYMLFSRTFSSARVERTYQLTPAQQFPIDPNRPSQVVASSGNRFQPGTLVDPQGKPATEPLSVFIGIVDPTDPDGGMPGDYLAVSNGPQSEEVALTSFGAISVSIENSEGTEFNLRPGAFADVRIPIPEARRESQLPESVPLWIYNETSGYWEKVGESILDGDAYVGQVPHFSEINADLEFTNPVCMRILVDTSLQSFLPFDVRIEVLSTGDVFVRELDNAINSFYALPASAAIEFVVLDTAGNPIEETRQTVSTGTYDPSCSSAPTYPYSCCTSQATLSISVPTPTDGFLNHYGITALDIFDAYWYTSVIDPVPAPGAGTITSSGTTITGTGTAFNTFFVPGDMIQPAGVVGAGTITTSGGVAVTGTGTTFTSLFNDGDIIEAGGQTRWVTDVLSNTSLNTNSPFDPPLTGAALSRNEIRLVQSVGSATSLTVDQAFGHAYTGVAYEKVGTKPNLTAWEAANNMGTPDAEAAYYNGADLGFGRYMKMKVTGGDVAYAVANYGTPGIFDPTQVALAALAHSGGPDLRFATVTMEHSPSPVLGGTEYTKFFVYGASGTRILEADLDGLGLKAIPKLCMICHAGNSYSADSRGDVGAEFLPFDLPAYEFSGSLPRAAQETDFKELNRQIRDLTTPPPALTEMIEGSYGGPALPSATFVDTFVPPAWNGNATERDLYNFVVKHSCRGCHVTRTGTFAWASYSDFSSFGGLIKSRVCGTIMPDALLTYENMWLSTSPHQPNVLATSGLSGWTGLPACP